MSSMLARCALSSRRSLRVLRKPSLAFCTAVRHNAHATLGVASDATPAQIKLAYYKLAMVHHPDKSDAPDAAERFAAIGAAYDVIMGSSLQHHNTNTKSTKDGPRPAPFAAAFPPWVYRISEFLQRVPQRVDTWLSPSYSSVIYQHLRANELADAFRVFEEMRLQGERPSHAIYEMLIRGCTIAMHRPGVGEKPDHLTMNLVQKVFELWGDMEKLGRSPDYLTYIELMRALGKGGAVRQALQLFEKMCGTVKLLPEERAFNTIYEACVLAGEYREALNIFDEQEEMRKSLWKPRFTPVTFSLLLTATAHQGPDAAGRIQHLPRVLRQMNRQGVLPRSETCERLISTCLDLNELEIAHEVARLATKSGHELDPQIITRFEQSKKVECGSARHTTRSNTALPPRQDDS